MTKLAMPYEEWTTYPGHTGIDWGQPEGTPIQASGPGVINYAGYMNERAGYGVTLSYDQYPGVEFLYCHQPKNAVRPKQGSRFVNLGYLGTVGNTGHSSGPHLHVEVSIGTGAHTADGVWLYFDKNNWIGESSPAGGGNDIELEIGMKNLEVWSCPAWEAASQRVVTNGTACATYPAGWAQMLQNNGAEFTNFELNDDMLTAIQMVWDLNGLSNAEITSKLTAMKESVGLK